MQVSDKHLLPNLMSWKTNPGNAWLAESVEHTALDLQVMRSSPTLGVEITLGRKKKKTHISLLVFSHISWIVRYQFWVCYGLGTWICSSTKVPLCGFPPSPLCSRTGAGTPTPGAARLALLSKGPPHPPTPPQEQPSRGESETAPTDHSSGNPWAPGQSHQSPRAPQSGKEIKVKLFSSDYNRHNSQFSNSGVQGTQLYCSLII